LSFSTASLSPNSFCNISMDSLLSFVEQRTSQEVVKSGPKEEEASKSEK
jgi:hypothetical protein